jgi:hypothetical protein
MIQLWGVESGELGGTIRPDPRARTHGWSSRLLTGNALLVIEPEQLKSRVLNLYANSAPSRIDTVSAVHVSDGAGQLSLPAQRSNASRSLPVHWRLPL